MKKIYYTFLLLALSLAVCAQSVEFEYNGLQYSIQNDEEIQLIGPASYTGTTLNVPATVTRSNVKFKVTSIKESAFKENKSITTVVLPEGLKVINDMAFNSTIVDSCKFPSTITKIGDWAFDYCKLRNADLSRCTRLKKIGYASFRDCFSLQVVRLPEGLTTLDYEAFFNTTTQTYYLPSTITNIENRALYNKASDQAKDIYIAAVNPPVIGTDGIIINTYANIHVPVADKYKNADVWKDLSVVTWISTAKPTAEGDTLQYHYKGNTLYYEVTQLSESDNRVTVVNNGGSSGWIKDSPQPVDTVYFPNEVVDPFGVHFKVTSLSNSALAKCEKINTVIFTDNTYIRETGFLAFNTCYGLEHVNLSDQITSVSAYSFAGTSLKEFDFKNVTSVGMSAFSNAALASPNIPNLHIPATLTSIDSQSSLFFSVKNITIAEDHPDWFVKNDMVFTKDTTKLLYAACGNPDGIYRIPKKVNFILANAFRNMKGTVMFPAPVNFCWSNGTVYNDNRNTTGATVVVQCGTLEQFQQSPYSTCFEYAKSITEGLVFEINLSVEGNGTAAIVDTTSCNTVKLRATPESEEYVFKGWSNGTTDAEITIEVDDDINLVATFEPKTGTALFDNKSADKAVKIIENGQIYIIRDGRRFTVLGTEI